MPRTRTKPAGPCALPMVLLAAGLRRHWLARPACRRSAAAGLGQRVGSRIEAAAKISAGHRSAVLHPLWARRLVTLCCLRCSAAPQLCWPGRSVTASVTWDCGYARPTARMQYTASSFAQPLTTLFRWLLGTDANRCRRRLFSRRTRALHTETPDLVPRGIVSARFSEMNWAHRPASLACNTATSSFTSSISP